MKNYILIVGVLIVINTIILHTTMADHGRKNERKYKLMVIY